MPMFSNRVARWGGARLSRRLSRSLPIVGASLRLYGLDPSELRPRLEVDLTTARKEVSRAQYKLANEKFTARAAPFMLWATRLSSRSVSALAAYFARRVVTPDAEPDQSLEILALVRTAEGSDVIQLRVLEGLGVTVHRDDRCTFEDGRLFSHRRAPGEGRFAGVVWRTGEGAA